MEDNNKRQPNWSESEKILAISIINGKYERLFGKFKGASLGNKKKEALWDEVAEELNSSGVAQCKRTVDQVKTMYKNVKSRAKTKDGERHRTGGGPAPKISGAEEECLSLLRDKPQLAGIEGAVSSGSRDTIKESMKEASSEKGTEVQDRDTDHEREPEPIEDCASSRKSEIHVVSSNSTCAKSKTKRRRLQEEDELYVMEKKRAGLEILLLEQRLQQEKDLHELKMEMLKEGKEQEKILFPLRQQILQSNVRSLLNDGLVSIIES